MFSQKVRLLISRLCPNIAVLIALLLLQTGICFAKTEEGYVRSKDGTRIFYKVTGNGPQTLLMLHGGPGNTLESIMPDLGPLTENHTIIYYDQRGSGRSDLLLDPGKLTLARHIDDLEAIRLHFNLNRLILFGFSWGGLLASFYAAEHPDHVEKMILVSAAPSSIQQLELFAGHIDLRIPNTIKQEFRALSEPSRWINATDPREKCLEFYKLLEPVYFYNTDNARKMRGDVCAGPAATLRQQLVVYKLIWDSLGEWDVQPLLKSVTAPVLVIHGDYDMVPVESSRVWTMAFPEAMLLVINNAGHMIHIEQPDIFFRAVETFLGGKWPAGAIKVSDTTESDEHLIVPMRE